MSCHGHLTQHYIETQLKVTLVIANVTVEEIAAIHKFLDEYRENKRLLQSGKEPST